MDSIFKNLAINISDLPLVEAMTFQRLSRNYMAVRYIGNAIFFLVLLVGITIIYFQTEVRYYPILLYIALVVWLVWFLITLFLVKKGYDIRGYVLREKDIIHRQGVLFKSMTTIPFSRVQHCEISQGPIQRLFNLNTLEIFTAGGSKSDLAIPGLEGETAQIIKQYIIKKAATDKDSEAEMTVDIDNTPTTDDWYG